MAPLKPFAQGVLSFRPGGCLTFDQAQRPLRTNPYALPAAQAALKEQNGFPLMFTYGFEGTGIHARQAEAAFLLVPLGMKTASHEV